MSKIEWTDETWNPVVGCSKVSPGCDNCYAERMAKRQVHMGTPHYQGITNCRGWTGDIGLAADNVRQKPLRWQKPRRIFVCSMGDLFHEGVPFDGIEGLFGIMAACPQHTFQLLTKRPARMKAFFDDAPKAFTSARPWPLPNVWLGVTAENQAAADERIPILLDTPAAVRFVSCEPLLGPVDIKPWLVKAIGKTHQLIPMSAVGKEGIGLGWVICGGESGPGARPMHPDWARSLRDQCVAAGVPFFFKQWGEWSPEKYHGMFRRFGKKTAGRLLDGRTWDQFPEVKT